MERDQETTDVMAHAIEDLQAFMANAKADTTEAAILAWQQGYISGVNRSMGIRGV
jgi:hypothetical protein|tara:strand:- start:2680 stop:2844 length:165 start_codon:yes stop_codon:yes gene_type:complete